MSDQLHPTTKHSSGCCCPKCDEIVLTPREYKLKIAELSGKIEKLQQWHDVVEDEAVVTWTLTKKNIDKPREMLNDIINWHVNVALDPAVSSVAADWQKKIAALDAENASLKATNTQLRSAVDQAAALLDEIRQEIEKATVTDGNEKTDDGDEPIF